MGRNRPVRRGRTGGLGKAARGRAGRRGLGLAPLVASRLSRRAFWLFRVWSWHLRALPEAPDPKRGRGLEIWGRRAADYAYPRAPRGKPTACLYSSSIVPRCPHQWAPINRCPVRPALRRRLTHLRSTRSPMPRRCRSPRPPISPTRAYPTCPEPIQRDQRPSSRHGLPEAARSSRRRPLEPQAMPSRAGVLRGARARR